MIDLITENIRGFSIGVITGFLFNLGITKITIKREVNRMIKKILRETRNTEDTMENQEAHPQPDPLAEAAKAAAPIVLTPEDWAVLEPAYKKWRDSDPRMEEIHREMKRLSSEAKMLSASQEFFGDLFWDEVAKRFPETKDQCMHYKDDDGKRIITKCGGHNGPARVIDIDADKLPPGLRNLLRNFGLGLGGPG